MTAASIDLPAFSCPKCKATIAADHPYAWCSACGKTLPRDDFSASVSKATAIEPLDLSATKHDLGDAAPASLFGTPERTGLCAMLGTLGLVLGFYLLLVAPATGASATVNLQRMYIGQTIAIIGAIFLAAAIRPR